ncbi:MAG: M1 family metallopeptidase [Flavobacteriales bacterium]|nr:M1 family metallopeptidase [Flavobacteriales bacterium]
MTIARWLHLIGLSTSSYLALGQCDRWQQRINCDLAVELDVRSHRFTGTEKLVYQNNSPDTLRQLFFHLYFNAFKPGSEMDVRSRTIVDPDSRVGDRIVGLDASEVGDLHCSGMMQDGRPMLSEELGTILRVILAKPLLPKKSTTISFDLKGQVPLQIRRSGRDSKEGIAYSMTQWFPKVAVYDHQGWHADPYVGREFYGDWGDYNVRLTLDSSFTVAASGELMNSAEIGHGYAPRTRSQKRTDGKLTWNFKALNVHDFAWAADPDYKHTTAQVPGGPLLHFIYQDDPKLEALWKDLPGYMVKSFQYMSSHFGAYPYPHFTFAQGGDGGMEYPNMTLITGDRQLGSLVGTSVHESIHNWYYGMLASDEGSYPWMDEGFTEYASSEVMVHLFPGSQKERVHADATSAYLQLASSDMHEPMSTHADHFRTNRGYGSTAYSKGEFFLDQLGYVIGDSLLHQGLLRYYSACRFKHPEPIDVQRVMEKQSGLQLDWYFDEWINTTRELDYAISSVFGRSDSTFITLSRNGEMLMPVDVSVTDITGSSRMYSVPLSLMLGSRQKELEKADFQTLRPWNWTSPEYTFAIPRSMSTIKAITVDPQMRMPDMKRENDQVILEPASEGFIRH